MASYLPHQEAKKVWESTYPTPRTRPAIEQPLRSAGEHPNFDRPWHGDQETQFKRIGHTIDQTTNTIGNILLYRGANKRAEEGGTGPTPPALGAPETRSRAARRSMIAIGPGSVGALDRGKAPSGVGPARGPIGELMPGPPVRRMNSQGTGDSIPMRSAEPFQPQLALGDYGQRQPAGGTPYQKRTRKPARAGMDARVRNAQNPTLF